MKALPVGRIGPGTRRPSVWQGALLLGLTAVVGLVAVRAGSWSTVGLVLVAEGLLIVAITVWVVRFRLRARGWADLGAIFAVFFGLYNGLLPLEAGLDAAAGRATPWLYPDVFSLQVHTLAGGWSLLALISYALVLRSVTERGASPPPAPSRAYGLGALSGSVAVVVGLALMVVDLARIGGLRAALSTQKGSRLDTLSEARGALPYQFVLLAGVVLLWLHYATERTRRARALAWGALAGVSLVNLTFGSRRYALYSVLAAFVIYSVLEHTPKFHVKRVVVILATGYLAFVSFGAVRSVIPRLVGGTSTVQESVAYGNRTLTIDSYRPSRTEFAGPYYSLLDAVEPSPLAWGATYAESVLAVLPRSIYPGVKPPTPGQQFAQEIYERHPQQLSRASGWGFSPVAESLRNFGPVGPAAVFALLALVLHGLSRLRLGGTYAVLSLAVLAPQVVNLNRTSFTLQEALFAVGSLFVVAGLPVIYARVAPPTTASGSRSAGAAAPSARSPASGPAEASPGATRRRAAT